jgi:hypothetical protein
VRRVLQRLLVWLAFAAALFAPALARAALLPTCDAHEQLTRMPAPSPPDPPTEDACSLAALQSPDQAGGRPQSLDQADLGDVRVAAMCDARGASVIAPQRVLAVADARIEAAPACETEGSGPAIGPDSHPPPAAGASVALADHAVLDAATLIPPAFSELAPPYPVITGGPRAAFDRGVDHPPR